MRDPSGLHKPLQSLLCVPGSTLWSFDQLCKRGICRPPEAATHSGPTVLLLLSFLCTQLVVDRIAGFAAIAQFRKLARPKPFPEGRPGCEIGGLEGYLHPTTWHCLARHYQKLDHTPTMIVAIGSHEASSNWFSLLVAPCFQAFQARCVDVLC